MKKYHFIWRRKSAVNAEFLVVVYGCFGNYLNQGIKAYRHIDHIWSFDKLKLCIKYMSLICSQVKREYLQKDHSHKSFLRANLIYALVFFWTISFALLGNIIGQIESSLIENKIVCSPTITWKKKLHPITRRRAICNSKRYGISLKREVRGKSSWFWKSCAPEKDIHLCWIFMMGLSTCALYTEAK